MLSGETANGPYFEAAVKVMGRTCCEAEQSRNYNELVCKVVKKENLLHCRQAAGLTDTKMLFAFSTHTVPIGSQLDRPYLRSSFRRRIHRVQRGQDID